MKIILALVLSVFAFACLGAEQAPAVASAAPSIFKWIAENYLNLGTVLLAGVALAEAIVRLTPTKSDDGAVERIGAVIRKICDLLKVPNNTK